jgi:hypothetical protein
MEFMKLNIQLFAISNSAVNDGLRSDAGNKATVYVEFTERDLTDQNIANNTTTIDLKGTYTQNTGSWAQISTPMFYLEWYDDKSATWKEVAKKNVTAMSRYDVVELTGTIDVEHKDNGTLAGRARARWVYEKSSTLVPRNGNATTSDTVLTQVPRETKFSSVTDAYIEENPTIKLNKQNPNATTTITWSCSGNGTSRSGTVVEKTSATEITGWSIPTSVYSCISSAGKSVTIYLTATTYNGSSALSQTSSTSFTATVKKERNLPNVSITAKDVNTATRNLTGNENVVVLNASIIECTYSATAKNGAIISSAVINEAGITAGNTTISGKKEISKPDTNVFKLTATDSRGFSDFDTDTKDYIPYFVPTLNATIERNTPTDGKVNISFSGTYFGGNFSANTKNELSVVYRYAEKGSSLPDWTEITPYTNGNNFSNNGEIQLDGFDYQKAYTFQLMISDKLNTKTINQDISVGRPSPWWDKENMYVDGSYYKRDDDGVLKRNSTPLDAIKLEAGSYLDRITTPGFYTGDSGLNYYQTPVPDGPFTLEVFVAPNGNVKQVYHKHRGDDGGRDNWSVATFERSYSTYWTRWTCVSGHGHAYNSTGEYGWYRVMTIGSTSGWANATGTLQISTSGGSTGSMEGEISFWYYNNDSVNIRVVSGNIPISNIKAIQYNDNTIGLFVCTWSWYAPLDVKIKEMTLDYYAYITPQFIGNTNNIPSGSNISIAIAHNVTESFYQTSEIAVGAWIDGKPIYRKVLDLQGYNLATYSEVSLGIAQPDTIVDFRIYFKYNNIWYAQWDGLAPKNILIKNGILSIDSNGLQTQRVVVILDYTKA